MILVDSSVWIEHLRGKRSRAALCLDEVMAQRPEEVAITEMVQLEILCGAGDHEFLRLQQFLDGLVTLPVEPARDFVDAAMLYQAARRIGRTVRKSSDCLIAAVAMRRDVEVWHRDADFEAIADAVPLRTVDLR